MKQLKTVLVVILPVLFVLNCFFSVGLAAEESARALDLVIKISNLQEKLQLIKSLSSESTASDNSPVAFVEQMLKGTDWVDPNRLIVLGGVMNQDQYEVGVLIPFQTPNPDFQSAMKANAGSDYYVFGFPMGASDGQPHVSKAIEDALVASSKTGPKDFFSVEISVNQLLKKGEPKIQEWITEFEKQTQKDPSGLDISPEDLKTAANNFIKTLSQIDVLAERVDFDEQTLNFAGELLALKDSNLFWIFSRNGNVRFLDHYTPQRHVNFRIGQYDIVGYTQLISNAFGMLYNKMGIDLESLSKLSAYFTGEMVGGIDLSKSGIQFEMIGVFDEKKLDDNFIEEVYLPWLKSYMKSMNAFIKTQEAIAQESIFLQMPDSEVEGHKVFGGMLQMPMVSEIVKGPSENSNTAMGQMFFRVAQVDKYLLLAPDDKRMGEMIKVAAAFTEKPDQTAFMTTEVDLDAYLNFITDGFKTIAHRKDLPKIGKMTFVTHVKDGKLTTTSAMAFDKIKSFMALYQSQEPQLISGMPSEPMIDDVRIQEDKAALEEKAKQKEMMDKENPDYWADKAGVSATYGNNASAVQYYEKAISLDPERSDFYYFMGVAYGEQGEFEKSIEAINQAISLNTANAHYYYGRGRVYLKSGNEEAAMRDFNTAAVSGDRDAQFYLIYKSRTQ